MEFIQNPRIFLDFSYLLWYNEFVKRGAVEHESLAGGISANSVNREQKGIAAETKGNCGALRWEYGRIPLFLSPFR